ncbi:hypothetical protein GOQ30_01065 [Flavobacterium sp. TP390]|uniref:Uncharacterized protein n=1 Tax=Flavobacterium profundi TaxID=1774945 RepID=A0A6I4IE95_9FLAO|nr:DUF6193 family natural product biosynthesis protein [Flavobacterium profundi]MVO07750.1 hypothetical protein [Flavobacterium profundi]
MITKFLQLFKTKATAPNNSDKLELVAGLGKVINRALVERNSVLRVSEVSDLETLPFSYAVIKNGKKFSQVDIAKNEKLFLLDFWSDGVCLANGHASSLSELVDMLEFWLCNAIPTRALAERFSSITANEIAIAFDANQEVAYTWNLILQDTSLELTDFVRLAYQDEVVRLLFPYTSLYTLCFSRCTGYPYDSVGLPNVTSKRFETFVGITGNKPSEVQYVVTINGTTYLGEGNAEEALQIVKAHLPKDITAARKGTAED